MHSDPSLEPAPAPGGDRLNDTARIVSGGERVYFVSDIHLGDGSHADIFAAKDDHFLAFLDEVEARARTLVILGDALDFEQAWYFHRIARAHGAVLQRLRQLAERIDVIYVCGNHDPDVQLYNGVLQLRLARQVVLDDRVLAVHGDEFDSYVGQRVEESNHLMHWLLWYETTFQTWVRLPLRDYYTFSNRLIHWVFAWLVRANQLQRRLGSRVGRPGWGGGLHEFVTFWGRAIMGDPMGITLPALELVSAHPTFDTVVCGHSHLPGVVSTDAGTYANLGSWSFGNSQFAVFEGGRFAVRDWITGREFGDENYRPIIEGRSDWTYLQWFEDQYLGWFRFRCGEEALRQGVRPRPWVLDRLERTPPLDPTRR